MKRLSVSLLLLCFMLLLTGASIFEGAAAVSASLPSSGFYVATNSFPRNTVIELTNLGTGRTVRVIVTAGLDTPGGLLAEISREAAESIGLPSRTVGRVRMRAVSDPLNFSVQGDNNFRSNDADFNPRAAIDQFYGTNSGSTAAAEAERAEAARLAAEARRMEAERAEAARLAAEAHRTEAERAEAARLAAEAHRTEAERAEAARLAAEAHRTEAERAEAARLAAEEAHRTEAERAEAARLAAARAGTDAEALKAEAARAEAEMARAEAERMKAEAEKAKAEAEAAKAEAEMARAEAEKAKAEADAEIAKLEKEIEALLLKDNPDINSLAEIAALRGEEADRINKLLEQWEARRNERQKANGDTLYESLGDNSALRAAIDEFRSKRNDALRIKN